MERAVTIALHIAKSVFQVHGVGATGEVVVRQRLSRGKVLQFFARIPTALVAAKKLSSRTRKPDIRQQL
jgi:transposase